MSKLPNHWVLKTFSEIAERKKHAIVDGPFGTQMKVHEFVNEGIPLIEMQNLRNDTFNPLFRRYITKNKFKELERSQIKPRDIIISKTGTLGLVAIVPDELELAIITSRLAKLSLDTSLVNLNYVYYYLIFLRETNYWENIAKGTTMKILTISDISQSKIPLPQSTQEQTKIVEEIEKQFTRLDESIKSLRAGKDKLEIYGKSVLKAAFEGNKFWNEKILQDVCEKITDGAHYTPKYVDKGYPFITVKNRKNNRLDFKNVNYISEDDYVKLRNNDCNPKKGDVLFSKDGTVGEVIKIDYSREFIVLSSWAILRPKKEINQDYLYWLMKSPNVLYQSINLKTGTAIRRIILRNLKTVKIKYPLDIEEQKQIVQEIESRFSVIDKLEQTVYASLDKAEQLRKSILKSAFEGKLVKGG